MPLEWKMFIFSNNRFTITKINEIIYLAAWARVEGFCTPQGFSSSCQISHKQPNGTRMRFQICRYPEVNSLLLGCDHDISREPAIWDPFLVFNIWLPWNSWNSFDLSNAISILEGYIPKSWASIERIIISLITSVNPNSLSRVDGIAVWWYTLYPGQKRELLWTVIWFVGMLLWTLKSIPELQHYLNDSMISISPFAAMAQRCKLSINHLTFSYLRI